MPPTRRRRDGTPRACRTAVWTVLGAIVVLASPVVAQFDPAAELSPDEPEHLLGPGESATVVWTVRNAAQLAADAVLTSTAPAGWIVELPQTETAFRLEAGAQRTVTAAVRAPEADVDVLPEDGPWRLDVTLTDDLGRSDQASSVVALAYAAPQPVVVPPAPDNTLLIAGLVAGGLLAAAVGAWVWQARPINVTLEENDLDVPLGGYAIVHARVHNKSRWTRNIQLRVGRLPPKWGGAFSANFVRVAGNESERVPMFLRLPFDDATPPEKHLRIQVRPNRGSPWLSRAELRIHAAEVRVPMLVRGTSSPQRNGGTVPVPTPTVPPEE